MSDTPEPGFILLAGLLSVLFGFGIWKTGWDPVRQNSVPHFVGILAMIYGVAFVFRAINKIRNRKRDIGRFLICIECGEVIGIWKVSERKCPKCGGCLEPLKGSYERHPERRDDTDHREPNKDT
jgi:hypothetical protein